MEQGLQKMNAGQRTAVWAERIAACRSSNLTVRAWCREHQLSEKTYYYWQHRLFKLAAEQHASFAEITPTAAERMPALAATVRVGRLAAEIYHGADTGTVETILRILSHAE